MINLTVDRITTASGIQAVREVVEHPGGAAVLPVFSNGDLLLVEQFRYPMRQSLLELPAGKIDPGELPEETAARELEEEVGFERAGWRNWRHSIPRRDFAPSCCTFSWRETCNPVEGQEMRMRIFRSIVIPPTSWMDWSGWGRSSTPRRSSAFTFCWPTLDGGRHNGLNAGTEDDGPRGVPQLQPLMFFSEKSISCQETEPAAWPLLL